jgi:catechol 2,3-dioxygenase-like lactoylglutathione lyase family enzyme
VKIKRIVADVAVSSPAEAKRFYQDVLGLETLMAMEWIATYGSRKMMTAQISFMSEGGSGAPVPDLSIEVDDLEEALARVKNAKIPIEYGPADEPWGVRRAAPAPAPTGRRSAGPSLFPTAARRPRRRADSPRPTRAPLVRTGRAAMRAACGRFAPQTPVA